MNENKNYVTSNALCVVIIKEVTVVRGLYTRDQSDVLYRFELAIQQNLILNVFYDDWNSLGEEDSNLGSKLDNHLKEYQSFTDLLHSKDKIISCIDWHPLVSTGC